MSSAYRDNDEDEDDDEDYDDDDDDHDDDDNDDDGGENCGENNRYDVDAACRVALWSSGGHLASGSEGPGFESKSTLSPRERLFTCISSPHSCAKRVSDCRQYGSMTRHL